MLNDIVLKALDRLICNAAGVLPDSILLLIWSTNFTVAYSVEWLEQTAQPINDYYQSIHIVCYIKFFQRSWKWLIKIIDL